MTEQRADELLTIMRKKIECLEDHPGERMAMLHRMGVCDAEGNPVAPFIEVFKYLKAQQSRQDAKPAAS